VLSKYFIIFPSGDLPGEQASNFVENGCITRIWIWWGFGIILFPKSKWGFWADVKSAQT